ncbi:MAG: LexA family transcriptional regulator [bacterium]|nr:LexA family transcriptional regulator [bacterium]
MIQVNENIKYLRKKNSYTQEQFAELIGIKRSLVGAYEEGRADPRLNNLLRMSEVFKVSVDTLLNKDVSKLSDEELYSSGGSGGMKVLSITVDKDDNENIELVPQKASAGYLNGYADPEFIEELPKFRLPMLPGNATYRAFEIQGDSMLPLEPGTVIIGQYIENVNHVSNGKTYVLVTKGEGVVYKRVFNYIDDKNKLYLVSDNKSYSAYDVDPADVMEIWEAKAFISVNFPDPTDESSMSIEKLTEVVSNLQNEVVKIKGDLGK